MKRKDGKSRFECRIWQVRLNHGSRVIASNAQAEILCHWVGHGDEKMTSDTFCKISGLSSSGVPSSESQGNCPIGKETEET